MSRPKRVLHFQGRMGKGGAETFMMNTYRNIDRSKIQFDFLIYKDYLNVTPYNDEIKKLGGKIYAVPNPKKNIIGYIRAVQKLLKDKQFDVVHSEVFFGGGLNVWLAKNAGIKQRIVHSHATTDGKGNSVILKGIRKFFDFLMFHNGTDFLACSTEAGIGLYGKDHPFLFVPNGIDLEKYGNINETKKEIKDSLTLSKDTFLVGNIGRFEEQKNHKFLIEIFKEVVAKNANSHLILIGEGSLVEEIRHKVLIEGLKDKVSFLGLRDDIPRLLKGMDVFLMPSLYEGLPISAVEAQATNTKLVLSTEVSKETQISKNVHFLPLTLPATKWAEKILEKPLENQPLPIMKQYDMHKTAEIMEKIYLK